MSTDKDTPAPGGDGRAAASPHALPFVVAVTGHRDPHPDDVALVREQLFEAIELIAAALPHSAIHFLSALADGADQIFAEEVMRLQRQCQDRGQTVRGARRIELIVPLPLPFEEYCIDQAGGLDARRREPLLFEQRRLAFAARFLRCCEGAGKVFVIEPPPEAAGAAPLAPAQAPYAHLTRYLAIHAHVLIAVWDGQSASELFPRQPGGTLDLVQTLLEGVERGHDLRSGKRFAEPVTGNVLHVYSRRARAASAGLPGARAGAGVRLARGAGTDVGHWDAPQRQWPGVLAPSLLEWLRSPMRACERWAEHRAWRALVARVRGRLGRELDAGLLAALYRVRAVGKDVDMLNMIHQRALGARDSVAVRAYAHSLRASGDAFMDSLRRHGGAAMPSVSGLGIGPLHAAFCVVDVQAERSKRYWRYRWRFLAAGAMLASAAPATRLLGFAQGDLVEALVFAVGALCAVGTYLWVLLSSQRNAYLDYRALAEGLRFQMYCLCAGEPSLVSEHYVLRQGGDMTWVRQALDACMVIDAVAGMSALPVLRSWIDDQMSYLNGAGGRRRQRLHTRGVALGSDLLLAGLLCSVGALALVLAYGRRYALPLALLISGMKLATGVGAAWLALNIKMGHGDTLTQAVRLRGVYGRAREALDKIDGASCSPAEKEARARDVLFALGKALLDENAIWLAAYQQRRLSWHGR